MRSLFFISVFACLLATCMMVIAAAVNNNSPATDYLDFLDHYNSRDSHHIERIKEFMQSDSYIAQVGLTDTNEDLIAHAQVNYAVVHGAPSVPSLRQFGILLEWLNTRPEERTAQAKVLIHSMAGIKNVLEESDMDRALDNLHGVYSGIIPFYANGPIKMWSFEQFRVFTFKTEDA
ncbi:hypothetical protein BDF22DRAFT_701370, partial [Syncephalis plumigaleata]